VVRPLELQTGMVSGNETLVNDAKLIPGPLIGGSVV